MTKAELRSEYIKKRKTLSDDEVLNFSVEIFNRFKNEFKTFSGQKVHCFLSISEKKEVDTRIFLNYFFESGCRVFVPKIVDGKLISIEIFQDSELIKNTWGILEPESNSDSGEKDFDLIITPLLYCDSFGNRVGFGKGYYDGFFDRISNTSVKIGVNFFEPSLTVDNISEKDVPLDYLITPTAVLSFGNSKSKSAK